MSFQNELDELGVGRQVPWQAAVKLWRALDVAKQFVAVQKHAALLGKHCVATKSKTYICVGSKQLCEASAQVFLGFSFNLLHPLVFV